MTVDSYGFTQVEWISGLLEGEGSFMLHPAGGYWYPTVQCGMTDEDVIERLHVNTLGLGVIRFEKPRDRMTKPLYRWRLTKKEPALALMRTVRPHMGARRQGQIDTVLDGVTPVQPRHPNCGRPAGWKKGDGSYLEYRMKVSA